MTAVNNDIPALRNPVKSNIQNAAQTQGRTWVAYFKANPQIVSTVKFCFAALVSFGVNAVIPKESDLIGKQSRQSDAAVTTVAVLTTLLVCDLISFFFLGGSAEAEKEGAWVKTALPNSTEGVLQNVRKWEWPIRKA